MHMDSTDSSAVQAKDKEKEQLTENMNKLHIEGSSSFGNGSPNFRRKPVIIIVVGMTDTGKTTFLHTLVCHTQMSNIRGYVVNLDPAIMTLPFAANIDIRDTVVDTPRSENPTTFMSNMLYACSILYKTRLPLILAFNKVDVAQHEFALEQQTCYISELGIKRIFWNTFSLNCQIEILGSCRTTNFAGPLPDYIANLMRLEYLNLADNNFSGSVPATWDRLSSLKHLLLKGNDLSGHIPDTIANLTGLAELDLSSNGLTGTIPMPLFSIPIFNFSNTLLHCCSSLDQPCASKPSLPGSTNKPKLVKIVGFASFGLFALIILGAIFIYRYNHMHRHKTNVFFYVSGEDESQISFWQLRRFSWRELQHVTNNL
ncbi:hypothetical protein S83_067455 [Arachis hypogaea]